MRWCACVLQKFKIFRNWKTYQLVPSFHNSNLSQVENGRHFSFDLFFLCFVFFYPRPIIFLRVCISLIFSLLLLLRVCFITLAFFLSLFDFFHFLWQKYPPVSVCVVRKTFRSYSLPRYLLSLSLFTLLPLFLSFSASSIFPSFFSSYHRDLGTFVFQGHTKNQGENQSVISAGKRDREREIEPWSSLS